MSADASAHGPARAGPGRHRGHRRPGRPRSCSPSSERGRPCSARRRCADCPGVQAPSLRRTAHVPLTTLASALSGITQQVTRAAIEARAGQLLMFHAGALCDLDTGATIAFVAPGGTGKTTLVRTLGPGRGYVTDETVGVRARRGIEPYCKPLSVRRAEPGAPKDEIVAARRWVSRCRTVSRGSPGWSCCGVTCGPGETVRRRGGRPPRRLGDARAGDVLAGGSWTVRSMRWPGCWTRWAVSRGPLSRCRGPRADRAEVFGATTLTPRGGTDGRPRTGCRALDLELTVRRG